jgi:hypothetical protein
MKKINELLAKISKLTSSNTEVVEILNKIYRLNEKQEQENETLKKIVADYMLREIELEQQNEYLKTLIDELHHKNVKLQNELEISDIENTALLKRVEKLNKASATLADQCVKRDIIIEEKSDLLKTFEMTKNLRGVEK